MRVRSLDREDPEEEMPTHSSILTWRIPKTEEPGGLQSVGSQSLTQLSTRTCYYYHLECGPEPRKKKKI